MRLFEFTNAEEQLKLLQLIFDTTFSTIRQQAEQQAREKAEQARLTKLKPKRKSSSKGACPRFCVNGLMAGSCRSSQRKRNDRKQRINRPPAGGLQKA